MSVFGAKLRAGYTAYHVCASASVVHYVITSVCIVCYYLRTSVVNIKCKRLFMLHILVVVINLGPI